jgi:nitrate/TMAO reductase-like tetraheme cytochrome c subunit
MSDTTKPKTSRTRKATFWVLMIGVVIGIVFWGGFNTAMEATNTEEFCISRHEGIAHSLPMQYDPEQDAPGESAFYTRLEQPHAGT